MIVEAGSPAQARAQWEHAQAELRTAMRRGYGVREAQAQAIDALAVAEEWGIAVSGADYASPRLPALTKIDQRSRRAENIVDAICILGGAVAIGVWTWLIFRWMGLL